MDVDVYYFYKDYKWKAQEFLNNVESYDTFENYMDNMRDELFLDLEQANQVLKNRIDYLSINTTLSQSMIMNKDIRLNYSHLVYFNTKDLELYIKDIFKLSETIDKDDGSFYLL